MNQKQKQIEVNAMLRKRKLNVEGFTNDQSASADSDPVRFDAPKSGVSPSSYHMMFTKATEPAPSDDRNLYANLGRDQPENIVRHKQNAFAGKKYGMGLKMMQKMGFVEGKGLGANQQGILEPIETQVRKMGVGIGDDTLKDYDEDDAPSDEEYYKEVPKKSLYQIIQELESKRINIPQWIKTLSDENSEAASKPFISMKRESMQDGIDLDEVRLKLNEINDQLEELLIDEKVVDHEINELEIDIQKNEEKRKQLNELVEVLKSVKENLEEEDLIDLISQLRAFISVPSVDVHNLIINIIKPKIVKYFTNWTPFNLDESETMILALENYKSIIPEMTNLEYNELSYFDSLISSLWLEKVRTNFNNNWTVNQPNLAITLLLDWNDIIPASVFNYFVNDTVIPKLINAITVWDYTVDENDDVPPYVWIFEWMGVLNTGFEAVENEFIIKYKGLLGAWTLKNRIIPGLNSFREIYGDIRYHQLVNSVLLKKVVEWFDGYQFEFQKSDVSYEFQIMKKLESMISDSGIMKEIWNLCYWNCWLSSIYEFLKHSKQTDFEQFADYIQEFYKLVKSDFDTESSRYFQNGLHLINQFLNGQNLTPFHHSHSQDQLMSKLLISSDVSSKNNQPSVLSTPSHKLTSTFKDVLEKYCNDNNLFLSPMNNNLVGKSTGNNSNFGRGNLMYKISFDPSGKKGRIGYIEHDVLFLKRKEHIEGEIEYWPVSIDNLIDEI